MVVAITFDDAFQRAYKDLTYGMQKHTMHIMKEANRNPVIRVYPQTRKKLKIIAAHVGETMQETVERLAELEIERLEIKKERQG